MLDIDTRRRIDTARDILVGKVPDPKSQVEQITIALIYKFMDDMDAQSEELGGIRKHFVGEYEKFGWAKLMSPALGGYDMLNLYSEAIDKMTRNEGVPQLFRDVFKNAYLPYRDPETLKLFLKTINEFNYDHSERLGDAFEYLLSVLGSQGDAGQFRTPRHIIEFMVEAVNPQKDESVLDPACGTAGFLISAYKHVMASNTKDGKAGGSLEPSERTKLANNIRGYDISPDMVRLSLVNMYLHGFNTPNIFEYDTLTSEDRWDEYADVILANPPFMSPRGGIKPHKRFSVSSNRSEVLFVDYMAEHLTPNGRAAFIVPEGIIFQSGAAYKSLRKYLVEENYLWAVVSLPAGVFNPYSGVKTSILFLDKALAKKRALSGAEGTDQILFVKVEADGFDLGAQRRPIDRNDLPDALTTLQAWHKAVLDGKPASFHGTVASALLVSTTRLAENGDYNLSADRYREVVRTGKQTYPMIALGEIATLYNGRAYKQEELLDDESKTPVLRVGNLFTNNSWYYSDIKLDESKYCSTGDLLYAWSASFGPFIWNGPKSIYHYHIWKVEHSDRVEKMFLYHMLQKITETIRGETHGIAMLHMTKANMEKMQIPLPPLEIQRQIVDEIAAHQRIIDGARQVVEGWKPNIEFDSDWEMVKLGGYCNEIKSGFAFGKSERDSSGIPHLRPMNINTNGDLVLEDVKYIPFSEKEKYADYVIRKGDVIFNNTNSKELVGKTCYVRNDAEYLFSNHMTRIRTSQGLEPLFLANVLYHLWRQNIFLEMCNKWVGQAAVNIGMLSELEIPLPPLEIQREIVARIEAERKIVEGNRELIRLYEAKVKQVIEKVWEA